MELLQEKKVLFVPEQHNQNTETNNQIVLCGDKNVIRALGVTVYSIAKHSKKECTFHIFFNGTLPVSDEEKLKELGNKFAVSIIIYRINPDIFKELYSSKFISITAYYRLMVPYVLIEDNIQKVLYIDSDVLCVKDISPVFTLDLSSSIAFVGKDNSIVPKNQIWWKQHCKKIGMAGTEYFNSGMLLINMPAYIKHNIGKKALALAAKTDYAHMDQDVLNIVLEGNVLFDEKNEYNCTMSIPDDLVSPDVRIVHFTGFKKPWKLYTSHWGDDVSQNPQPKNGNSWKYQYYKLWRDYAAESPW